MRRATLSWISVTMIVVSFLLTLGMLWLRARTPEVADLYNLVYDGERPKRPEGTSLFLLVFPAFALTSSISFAIFAKPAKKYGIVLATSIWAIFVLATLYRFFVVVDHFQIDLPSF